MSRTLLMISLMLLGLNTMAQNESRDSALYRSPSLRLIKLAPGVYQHISWLKSPTFGKVDCNGMIVVTENGAFVFDTPADDSSSIELLKVIADSLKVRVNAVVATHFHEDCVGGLGAFHQAGIASWASEKTIELLKKQNAKLLPTKSFTGNYYLRKGSEAIELWFPGEGHTRDNIVAWYAKERVLFGGCLVKATGASKGNLADANEKAWSKTISKVIKRYPQVQIVIPGHGKTGGKELLAYTMKLFENTLE